MIYQKYTGEIELKNTEGENLLLSKDEVINKQQEEIERLKEEYVMLQNASDKVEEEKDREIERLNNIINKTSKKLEMTLNCIKDYMVENEEYIKIHTDYIYALEEQINILKGSDKE